MASNDSFISANSSTTTNSWPCLLSTIFIYTAPILLLWHLFKRHRQREGEKEESNKRRESREIKGKKGGTRVLRCTVFAIIAMRRVLFCRSGKFWHSCTPPNGAIVPTPMTTLVAAVANPAASILVRVYGPFQPTATAADTSALAGWMANAAASFVVSILKHPRTPPATLGTVDYHSPGHEQLMKSSRSVQSIEE